MTETGTHKRGRDYPQRGNLHTKGEEGDLHRVGGRGGGTCTKARKTCTQRERDACTKKGGKDMHKRANIYILIVQCIPHYSR